MRGLVTVVLFARRRTPRSAAVVFLLSLLVSLAGALALAPALGAAQLTVEVNTTGDQSDANVVAATALDGICDVDTTTTGPQCTLRAAIEETNGHANVLVRDVINFEIPGSGVHTIAPASALPTITDAVEVNGYSQTGASANTLAVGNDAVQLIQLDGSGTPVLTDGLTITASGSRISGLVVNRFPRDGILITGGSGSVIAGNFLGTDAAGTADLGNGRNGAFVSGANTVGGTAPADRNVSSGNGFGVQLDGVGGQVVQGNYIGTDRSGLVDLGNSNYGINARTAATIGGTTAAARNIISGNDTEGIDMGGAGGALVQGNYIGLNANGAALGNANRGLLIVSAGHTIDRNVISANGSHGIWIVGAASTTVTGNLIGTDPTGLTAIGNGTVSADEDGIRVTGGSNGTLIGGTTGITPGGPCTGACNLISGNADDGIEVSQAFGVATVTIHGNFVGTDLAGTGPLANGDDGISLDDAVTVHIGGAGAAQGNVISANTSDGVQVDDTDGAEIHGNYIGTNAAGTAALGNGQDGLHVQDDSDSTLIGTTTGTSLTGACTGGCNVISGNTDDGIDLDHPIVNATTISSNHIGTNAAGSAALGNGDDGIDLHATGTTIGGSTGPPGEPCSGACNLISGNTHNGIDIDSDASDTTIQGNFIGLDGTGELDLGNGGDHGDDGITVDGALDTYIGGGSAATRNVISGNDGNGIEVNAVTPLDAATGTFIEGNFIGTDTDGLQAVPNGTNGVYVNESDFTTIGGTLYEPEIIIIGDGEGNVIAGHSTVGTYGVFICCDGATSNVVKGNFIGVAADGVTALPNHWGIFIDASIGNTVGGTAEADRNVISGNAEHGLVIKLTESPGNTVQGNYIGTDHTGGVDLGNAGHGVFLFQCGSGNMIGGSVAGAGNVISGNDADGVQIATQPTTGNCTVALHTGFNQLLGNLIGTAADGTSALANGSNGVQIVEFAHDNVIGGIAAGEGNVIAYNTADGVAIPAACIDISNCGFVGGTGNVIRGNSIHSNGDIGIDLGVDNPNSPQEPTDIDIGPNMLQNFPSIITAESGSTIITGSLSSTPETEFDIDLYANQACDTPFVHGEGAIYLGSTTTTTNVSGVGTWTLNLVTDVPTGYDVITGTATDPAGNTSEFSGCLTLTRVDPTESPSPTASATASPTASATATPSPTATPTATPSPTASPTATATASPSPSATASPTASASPSPSATASPTASATASPTATASATASPSATATASPTATPTPSATSAATATRTATGTPGGGAGPGGARPGAPNTAMDGGALSIGTTALILLGSLLSLAWLRFRDSRARRAR